MIKDIRPALRTFLLADASIAAIVGTRVFPVVLPQGEKRASIVYFRVSGQGDYHMEGRSGLVRPRYQVDAWAPSADEATALANAVKARLDGYRGLMDDVRVQGVFLEDEREDYQPDIEMHRASRDFAIWYEDA